MTLRPEHRMILTLTSEQKSRQDILEFLFSESISWDFFITEILRHNVGPLIFEIIHHGQLEDLFPPTVIQELKKIHQQTAFFNMFLYAEAKKIVQALSQKNIPAILFKGASLSQDVYGNIALRPSADIDILVQKDSIQEVKKTFFELGFSFPQMLMSEDFYYRNHFHIPFSKNLKNFPIEIEIHWNLMDKYLLAATNIFEIWERKRNLDFEGAQTYGLSYEDELIYLALHTLKHGYMNTLIASNPLVYLDLFFNPICENKLIWFIDLKKIIESRSSKINWDHLIQTANRWGVLESIHAIFLILKNLFPHLEIPVELFKSSYKITWIRKLLFLTLIKHSQSPFIRKHLLTMKGELQFRLIRVFDIWEYLLPKYSLLKELYHFKFPFFAVFYYPVHLIKTIYQGFAGLAQWMLFKIRRKK